MRATLLLCDHAAVADGKLYIHGAGWTQINPAPSSFGIAVIVGIPWDRTNVTLKINLRLETEDGHPVVQGDLLGEAESPVEFEAELEVGRPPGLKHGTTINFPLAVQHPGLPLAADTGYTWRLTIDEEQREDWTLNFRTRPAS